ncbi:glycerophosphodiester phosphodiesterase [Desulfonema ishimotonii]|uniref:glycerophosphodiester phosphodiesterase n=1 Tax=Desulfonema ishimotonii TaxID=45657 RepID=A0A401G384_9BACT|nr:glycerophosphodiester phosphodiesterase [Desulfonema ishimotonii]GBC63690.1 glycerophosphodiester phosphodiesterase [Desulfonema ishimotonii]
MKRCIMRLAATFMIVLYLTGAAMAIDKKIVIAHRGACGYLPEHSLAAKAMAYGMGADYIEQDLVMTMDNRLVVLHDHYLDRVTNVAEIYPDRKRDDGRYYVIDFTLDEIRQLEMTEGFTVKDGKTVANFPARFPIWHSAFRVSTFEEEIEMIQGMNKSTGRDVGIYPEIKSPWFHRHEGKDISKAALAVLKKYGYTTKSSKVWLQCFDPNETERIHNELFKEAGITVRLVQLLAETDWNETMVYEKSTATPYSYDWMFEKGAMQKVAQYADGVGPWKPMIVRNESERNKLVITDLVKEAHDAGMEVHPYTFRLDQGRIPQYAASFEDMLDIFYYTVGVDGVFTDFPDRAVDFLRRAEGKRKGL